jgi:hypothetical protein
MSKLKEYYEGETIDATDKIRIRTTSNFGTSGMGIIGNSGFTFTHSEDTNFVAGGVTWRTAQDKAESGNGMDIRAAESKMEDYQKLGKILAAECNRQRGGTGLTADEVILESTGLPLAKVGEEVGVMDKPVINSIEPVDGIAGRGVFNIKKSTKFCHGTHIQIQDVLTGTITQQHSRLKHIFPIDGYVHNKDTMNRVAYDGTDETLVWSDWKPFQGN